MVSDFDGDFIIFAFTLITVLCQIYFLAWMGDKLTAAVIFKIFINSRKEFSIFHFQFFRVRALWTVYSNVNGMKHPLNTKESYHFSYNAAKIRKN